MREVLVDGKWVRMGDVHEHKFCSTCGGILKEGEKECPVCKARAYETQVLKERLELIRNK